jgi:hypothetical protein
MTSGGAEGGDLARAARIRSRASWIRRRQWIRGKVTDEESAEEEVRKGGRAGGGPSSREVWSVDAARGRRRREKRGAREAPPNFPSL